MLIEKITIHSDIRLNNRIMKQQYYECFYKFCSNEASNEAAIQLNSLSDQQIRVSLTLFFGGACTSRGQACRTAPTW